MSISSRYVVHSVSTEKVPVEATIGSRTVTAEVDGFVVELENENTCHTHRFVPGSTEEAAALAATFEVGSAVIVTFVKE